MNRSEIVVGGQYEGKNGSIRDVMDEGSKYVGYQGQGDRDCVLWAGKNGKFGNCTRTAFASWAKRRIVTIEIEAKKEAK